MAPIISIKIVIWISDALTLVNSCVSHLYQPYFQKWEKSNAAFRPHSNACTFPYVWEIRFLIPNSHFLFFVMSGLTAMCSQRNNKKSSWSPIARDVQGRCPIGEGSSDIPRRMESDWLLTCVLCVYLPCFSEPNFPRDLDMAATCGDLTISQHDLCTFIQTGPKLCSNMA